MNEYNVLKYGVTGIAAPDMSFYDTEAKLITTAAIFLGKQMES